MNCHGLCSILLHIRFRSRKILKTRQRYCTVEMINSKIFQYYIMFSKRALHNNFFSASPTQLFDDAHSIFCILAYGNFIKMTQCSSINMKWRLLAICKFLMILPCFILKLVDYIMACYTKIISQHFIEIPALEKLFFHL